MPMAKRIAKRGMRTLTPAERERLNRALETVDAEIAELLPAARKRRAASAALRDACRLLRTERQAQGLSLADVSERTGISRTEISRLETAANKNPTINSLQRIASALGKELIVSLR
jgi:DNA-binding phage protein